MPGTCLQANETDVYNPVSRIYPSLRVRVFSLRFQPFCAFFLLVICLLFLKYLLGFFPSLFACSLLVIMFSVDYLLTVGQLFRICVRYFLAFLWLSFSVAYGLVLLIACFTVGYILISCFDWVFCLFVCFRLVICLFLDWLF